MYSQKENLKKLKKTYKEQAIPKGLKEEIRQRFIIEEQSFIKAKRRKRRLQGFGVSLAIVMITTSSLLFNSQVRSFAEDLPILGSVIELILGERFTDRSEKIDIQVPKINTQNEKENKTIHGLNQKYFREGQADFEKAEKEYCWKNVLRNWWLGDYQKIVDDNRFLVIERQITQTAADSHVEKRYDTIDKKNSVQLSLPLLFKDDTYLSVLTKEVKRQMAEQVKEDPSKYYWTEQDIQEGTIEKPTLVTPTRSFYLNKEHQLVLTFSQYEIAPGYMGTPEFVIPKSVTKTILASEDYLDH
ncbi:hypothetical protein EfmJHP35_21680 [Enterococcus faecium]|nr:hypothetical protein EfmJHP35_21680 [Enterococcus faecium]